MFPAGGIQATGNSIGVGAQRNILVSAEWPSGTLWMSSWDLGAVTTTFTPTSGTVYLNAAGLQAGMTVTSISYLSAVGITSPTHYQFGLYNSSAGAANSLVASSVDQTSTAWATNTVKTLAMSTPYVVPTTGVYFVAMFYTGSALTLRAAGTTDQINILLTPKNFSSADTGITALASTAAAQTGITGRPLCWIT